MNEENNEADTDVIEILGEEVIMEEIEFEQEEETVEVAAVVEEAGKLAPPSVDEVLELARELGCLIKEQTFHKVTAPMENRKAVYIAKTKRGVTRVDISGFEVNHPLVRQLTAEQAKDENLGKVRGQILVKNLDPGADVLSACRAAFEGLLTEVHGDKLVSRKDAE